jgi:hypothetical protein
MNNENPEPCIANEPSVCCEQVHVDLLEQWPETPLDSMSATFLDHLCQCRVCLRKWIALEAAAALAEFPAESEDSFAAGRA